jgi:adenosylhomocysteine nucleosidase
MSTAMDVTPNEERLPVLVVTGMAKEMRLAGGPGLIAVAGGGDPVRLRRILSERDAAACRAVLSFGIAGGLDPDLAPGDAIVATGIIAGGERYPAHPALADWLSAALANGGVRVRLAEIAGSDAPVLDVAAKADMRRTTGAAAVDMESHIAAAFAARSGLMFAAVRIICDPAARSLPPLVANVLRPDGGVDHRLILANLLRRPRELAALSRLAGEARTSFRVLGRCGDLLGIGRGLPNLFQPLGDVA